MQPAQRRFRGGEHVFDHAGVFLARRRRGKAWAFCLCRNEWRRRRFQALPQRKHVAPPPTDSLPSPLELRTGPRRQGFHACHRQPREVRQLVRLPRRTLHRPAVADEMDDDRRLSGQYFEPVSQSRLADVQPRFPDVPRSGRSEANQNGNDRDVFLDDQVETEPYHLARHGPDLPAIFPHEPDNLAACRSSEQKASNPSRPRSHAADSLNNLGTRCHRHIPPASTRENGSPAVTPPSYRMAWPLAICAAAPLTTPLTIQFLHPSPLRAPRGGEGARERNAILAGGLSPSQVHTVQLLAVQAAHQNAFPDR